MSARRIARELAVIVMPQLPKNLEKLEESQIMELSDRAVRMLIDYARQNLTDAQAMITESQNELSHLEVEHPVNADKIDNLSPVKLDSAQLKSQLQSMETTINLVSEALDIPEMALASGSQTLRGSCKKCGAAVEAYVEKPHKKAVRDFVVRLVSTYLINKETIDEFIKRAKTKWRVERMVSIDRDILRLACAEAFYMEDIPVNVAISEAVELSLRFADAKAAKFINGILGEMAEEAEAVRKAAARKRNEMARQQQ